MTRRPRAMRAARDRRGWRGTDHVKVYDRDALDLCLQHWAKSVTVDRNGVRFAPYGGKSWGYGRFASQLIPFKRTRNKPARKLHVAFDPDDLSRIRVFDEQLRFVAELERNEKGTKGNREQVKRLQRAKRERDKALQIVRDTNHFVYHTDAQIMAIENAGRGPSPLPTAVREANMKLVQTMLDRPLKVRQKRFTAPQMTPDMTERLKYGYEEWKRRQEEDEIDLLADDGTLERVMASLPAADDEFDAFDVLGTKAGVA